MEEQEPYGFRLPRPQPPPPSTSRPFVPLFSPKSTAPRRLVLLGQSYFGYYTHFVGNRTVPCLGAAYGCPTCHEGRSARWKAFLSAVDALTRSRVVLELTEGAVASCPELSALDGQLRGCTICVARAHAGRQAAVKAVLTATPRVPNLPEADSVPDMLARLWGIKQTFMDGLETMDLKIDP